MMDMGTVIGGLTIGWFVIVVAWMAYEAFTLRGPD